MVVDAAFRVKDLAVDVNYWMDRAKRAENELASFKASQVQTNVQLSKERENITLLQENNLTLKQQVHRLKKDKRFSLGPFAGMVIGQGEIPHPAVGVGLTFSVVSFGRF